MAKRHFVVIEEAATSRSKLSQGGSLKTSEPLLGVGNWRRNSAKDRICHRKLLNGIGDSVSMNLFKRRFVFSWIDDSVG